MEPFNPHLINDWLQYFTIYTKYIYANTFFLQDCLNAFYNLTKNLKLKPEE